MNSQTMMLGAALLALSGTLAGCATGDTHSERGFGDSVRATAASQVVNPAAARNTNPVAGLDGHAARAAQMRYEASFANPTPAEQTMTTGVGK